MRKLHLQNGGRPRSLDDLQVLTDHITKGTEAQFKGRGAFIVQGCEVVGSSINAGIVFIDGNLIEFAGADGVTFPTYMKADAEVFDVPQQYEDGVTKTTQRVITASLSASAPGSGEYITFAATGGRTYFDAISDKVVTTYGTQTINGVKSFVQKIITAGMNVYDEITSLWSNKADKSTTITGSGALIGGGSLAANRSLDVRDGGISEAKIAAGAVTNGKLGAGSVSSDKIADGAVSNSKLANGSVSNNKLAANSVGAGNIIDGNVTTSKLADGSVTNSKLADGAVTNGKIGDLQVTGPKIAAGTITIDKVASNFKDLWRANEIRDDYSIDWTNYTGATGKTYGNKSFWNNYNTSQWKPLVEFAFYAMRDSGGLDRILCELQRANNVSFSGATVIARRYFRLDGESWQRCVVKKVDTGAVDGYNYYRLVCTNVQGTGNNWSNSFEGLIIPIKYY